MEIIFIPVITYIQINNPLSLFLSINYGCSRLNWSDIRREFTILNEITYINAASIGLIPESAIKEAKRGLEERRYGNIYWLNWYKEYEEALKLFAKLINASETEVTGVYNTSEGLNLVANSIKWIKGGNIITNDLEFPTNIFIWQVIARKYNLELKIVKNKNGYIDIRDYEETINDKTIAIAISWVEFSNGYVHDLEKLSKLAHEHEAYIIVDGIQGVGSLPLDVRRTNIDFLSCGGQKWLMGLTGTGFLYIKKEVLDELNPPFAGWLGDAEPFRFDYREYKPHPSARRFDLGTQNFIGYIILKKTLGMINEIGINNIYKRNIELAKILIEYIDDLAEVASPIRDGEIKSPIISLKVKNAEKIHQKLKENKIYVALRAGNLRVSPHLYNNEEDIDRFVDALRKSIMK